MAKSSLRQASDKYASYEGSRAHKLARAGWPEGTVTFCVDDTPKGKTVSALGRYVALAINHRDGLVQYIIRCDVHNTEIKLELTEQELLEGLADEFDFPAKLADTFSSKLYTRHAVRCEDVGPFLQQVKEKAHKCDDFLIRALVMLGPTRKPGWDLDFVQNVLGSNLLTLVEIAKVEHLSPEARSWVNSEIASSLAMPARHDATLLSPSPDLDPLALLSSLVGTPEETKT